jgi:hypothetical protein
LPAATQISPDRLIADNDGEAGYPFPITAFIDTNNDGIPGSGESQNTTIDRVFVGFLRLVKETRLLQGNGPAIPVGQGTFSTSTKTPAPGNIIEFRITYTNITTGGGTNSVILNASNITIDENGTTGGAGGNNWALDQDPVGAPGRGIIDTSNVVGTATDSAGATINFFSGAAGATAGTDVSGTTQATDVTRYQLVTGTSQVNWLIPGQSRTFTFQRRVN